MFGGPQKAKPITCLRQCDGLLNKGNGTLRQLQPETDEDSGFDYYPSIFQFIEIIHT